MRILVVGYGVQGKKRAEIAKNEVVGIVDPFYESANYSSIYDVPLNSFDAAFICTPDNDKYKIIEYCILNHKHMLVEKPIYFKNEDKLKKLKEYLQKYKTTLYTAYNHRFEPHFVKMNDVIKSNKIGKIYYFRMFYGNGTANLVKNSSWRDKGDGVVNDLGSHLLDTALYWFGKLDGNINNFSSSCFENKTFDHVSFGINGTISAQFEVSLLSWRNHFYADVIGEKGSAHIESLCKWGPSTFRLRNRVLPSGKPDEISETLVEDDKTWRKEYDYFLNLCKINGNNLNNDIWISNVLNKLNSAKEVW